MEAAATVDVVVIYERQEYYVSAQVSPDRRELHVDILQCQLLSLVGVVPEEQVLVSCTTGEVVYGPSQHNETTTALFIEPCPRFFLFPSSSSRSELPEIPADWRQICTKSTFGDAAVVQPAFRKIAPSGSDLLATLVCEPCARTCSTGTILTSSTYEYLWMVNTGFQLVSPLEWTASQEIASRFISEITIITGDVDVAAPSGFTRLPVELNYSTSGDYMYLCIKRGGPRALTQIRVLSQHQRAALKHERVIEGGSTGDRPGPLLCIGYDRVQLQGNLEQLQTPAIADIAVVVGNQPPPSPSYVKISENLNEGVMGSFPVFLYYLLLPLGGFVCDSRRHSDFGECLFATRRLNGVDSVLELDEQRLTLAHTVLAVERKRGDTAVLEKYYRQNQPRMLQRLQSGLERAQSYEDKTMQEEALKRIPVEKLHERARTNPSPMPLYQDELLKQLLHWFKHEFFSWMNQPACSKCKHGTTRMLRTEGPTTAEEIAGQASRVEIYQCPECSALTRFPRYNNPIKLLDTRTGRCGEWANCFTLCCRAMGFEARYVVDVTDHVWTEVYSEHFHRWLHCDACEDQLDCPLTYEVGWGKKLSYIFSFAHDEVVDTARRYTQNWSEMLTRRQDVSEKWLETTIRQINSTLWERLNPERKALLTTRARCERDELHRGRSVKKCEEKGRVSGSVEWKLERNEAGTQGKAHARSVVSTAKTTTFISATEILHDISRNLVIGCRLSECWNPFCFRGRTRLKCVGISSDVNERAAQALETVAALSSKGFSPESLTMLLCPEQTTELRHFVWKHQPLVYLPLQDVPSLETDRKGSVPLLDISSYANHVENSECCALRKPFQIPTRSFVIDSDNEAGSRLKNEAFGLQLLMGKYLSISKENATSATNFVLSFLVRFDKQEALDKTGTLTLLSGQIGPSNSSWIHFCINWNDVERQFSCKLAIQSETPDTAEIATVQLAFSQYNHVALTSLDDAVALYINARETLVLDTVCPVREIDVKIQGPTCDHPSVATVISHVAVVPASSLQTVKSFCVGMKPFVSAPPLKAFGPDGERRGEKCTQAAAAAQSGYRVAQILMWGSEFLDGIQFVYEALTPDTNCAASGSPATIFSSFMGTASAKQQMAQPMVRLELLVDEVVVRVSGRKGAWTDSITLHTNFGRFVTCGGKGGSDFIVPTPVGSELRSISFQVGGHLTDICAFVLENSPVQALEDLLDTLPSGEPLKREKAISAGNIAQQPEELTYQRIRASNKFFASHIGSLGAEVANSFMEWCGFQLSIDQADEFFTFQPLSMHDKPSPQRLAAEAQKRLYLLKNVTSHKSA
ncbi:hypothetical protein PsorP6_008857 [Peronosclerospora sorghi]|uniref:Uncharacterized protein n=1 Tax=Peronosclerospora sorghi TaxID=230839 RepID=A0ACC0W2C5_9STRA|nr:hypothetical protein PsorP6_008857 [Peronosclerospora sorghi]